MPEPIKFDPEDKKNFTFEPQKSDTPSLSKKLIEEGSADNYLSANIILITFSIIFLALSVLIIKYFVIDFK